MPPHGEGKTLGLDPLTPQHDDPAVAGRAEHILEVAATAPAPTDCDSLSLAALLPRNATGDSGGS